MLHTQTAAGQGWQVSDAGKLSNMADFLVSYLLVRSLMTFQSRGKMLSFIRFLNTHKIFNKNS